MGHEKCAELLQLANDLSAASAVDIGQQSCNSLKMLLHSM